MRRLSTFVVIACFATAVAGAVQQQAPVFRSRIDLARLDVTVIDNKTGKPLEDLKEADFTVVEDGVTQKISTFARELIGAVSVAPAPATGSNPAPTSGPLAARNRRVFLIVLGYGDMGGIDRGPVKPYEGAREFIRERLLPQDLVSILAFNRATDLGTNRDYAIRVIDRLQAARDAITYDMFLKRPLTQYVPVTDMAESTQASIDAIFRAPGSSEPAARSVPAMLIGTEEFRLNQALGERRSRPRPWNNMVVGSDLLKIYAGIEYLRHVEGEKHVICMTTGMFMNVRIQNMPPGLFFTSREDNARLATRANDAQVAINIIGTAGTFISVSGGGRTFSGGTDAGEIMSSETASELSGGQYTSVRMASAALARIDQASRFGYILCGDDKQDVVCSLKQQMALDMDEAHYQVAMRDGIPYRTTIPLTGQASIVKVLVYDYDADLLGSKAVKLR